MSSKNNDDILGNDPTILSSAAVDSAAQVEFGPTFSGPDVLPPIPPGDSLSYFLDPVNNGWRPFNPRNYEARTVFSEQTTAFDAFSSAQRMVLLTGPGGGTPDAHRWNAPGFDFVGFNVDGPLTVSFVDEKAGAVKDVTALTDNWTKNLSTLKDHLAREDFNNVPRINDVRRVVDVALSNARKGLPPPSEVRRAVTRFGDVVPLSPSLAAELASGKTPALSQPTKKFLETQPVPEVLMSPPATIVRQKTVDALAGVVTFGMNTLNELAINHSVNSRFEEALPQWEQYRHDHPDKGVLIVVPIMQSTLGEIRPAPQALTPQAFPGYATLSEAKAAYDAVERHGDIVPAYHELLDPAYQWLPPLASSTR